MSEELDWIEQRVEFTERALQNAKMQPKSFLNDSFIEVCESELKHLNTIKQALLKAQKEHKALETIKKYFNFKFEEETLLNGEVWGRLVSAQSKEDEDTWDTTACANLVDYKEDFNLLKEVLE